MAVTLIVVLSSALICSVLLIVLSWRYELTVTGVLFKILCRIGIRAERLRPAEVSTPYRRLKNIRGEVHRPVLLNLETSEGSGQVTHPDVAYIPQGFGAGNWSYWMACTPYPDRNDRFENPEIFVSCDGIHWAVPSGLTNPVVPWPGTPGDHNSDPDILFHSDELWMFYRQTIGSRAPRENRILLTKSADGVRWSRPVQVLRDASGRQLLSPAVIDSGDRFLMWTVEECSGGCVLMRRTSPNGVEWSEPELCRLEALPKPRRPWHIDVIQERDRLSALLVSCTGLGGVGSRIHYAYSQDEGFSWSTEGFLFDQVYEFEAGVQYRGSLVQRAGQPGEYDLWYSAASRKFLCSIAYVRVTRENNRMLAFRENTEVAKALNI